MSECASSFRGQQKVDKIQVEMKFGCTSLRVLVGAMGTCAPIVCLVVNHAVMAGGGDRKWEKNKKNWVTLFVFITPTLPNTNVLPSNATVHCSDPSMFTETPRLHYHCLWEITGLSETCLPEQLSIVHSHQCTESVLES
ncbi:hypothetical protein NQZ68_024688 [Dissostichus eleginoides]|nr:hypothetical protein NQZ68_024688 [Dissostichus eleginoides]